MFNFKGDCCRTRIGRKRSRNRVHGDKTGSGEGHLETCKRPMGVTTPDNSWTVPSEPEWKGGSRKYLDRRNGHRYRG